MGERDTASWASESLPLSLRKELLARELKKLGFGRSQARAGSVQQQQQPQPKAGHPQADTEGCDGE